MASGLASHHHWQCQFGFNKKKNQIGNANLVSTIRIQTTLHEVQRINEI